MSQALSRIDETKRSPPGISGGIPPAAKRTAAVTGYLHNNLEPIPGDFRRYALSAAVAPTDEQRALLLERRQEIDDGLVGADDLTIREKVGILRSSMATAPLSEQAMHLAKQAFIMVLGKYPAWAIAEATMRFLDGRAGNGTYAPTAAEMANVCRTLIADELAERARINAILDAGIYHIASAAKQAEIQAMHAEFVRETAQWAKTSASKPAPEPTPDRHDPAVVADLIARAARREAKPQSSDASDEQGADSHAA